MTRAVVFLVTLILSSLILPKLAWAFTPQEYVQQVMQKDLPQVVSWFEQIAQVSTKTQAEAYSLFQSALPESQPNRQKGISVRGSVERMLLLLEGAQYFEQVQRASVEFHGKKEKVLRILQAAKDPLDRLYFGEDPQILLEERERARESVRAEGGVGTSPDPGFDQSTLFATEVKEVFSELLKLVAEPPVKMPPLAGAGLSLEAGKAPDVDAQVATEGGGGEDPAPAVPMEVDDSFEQQRFVAYTQSAEAGRIAEECAVAQIWKTDRAESCQRDDTLECDRNYARQCKKLQ